MKRDDARRLIISEWHQWRQARIPETEANGTEGFVFFRFLQRERPGLLNFRDSGDKWQTIHAWLLRDGLVSD
jgi:hypothetical protein